ncbi:MAG TPA: hypothetical protein V6D08_03245 [Candidatus Obscuribacterales bacterium]
MNAELPQPAEQPRPAKAPAGAIWVMALLALAGLLAYLLRSGDVFPSASIELRLPRKEIARLAAEWATSLGYSQSGAIRSTVFGFEENAKTFLEYELGAAEANALMKERIPVWYWSTRFCKPLQLEECTVALSPAGRLTGFIHTVENDRALPSLSHEQARQLAMRFVEDRAKVSLARYKPVEDGIESQPHRTDHYFTWEDTSQEFKGARLRAYVYVSGNMLTMFSFGLYVPENWQRKFSELRSYNAALEDVASIFYVTFNAATFFAFVWVFTSGNLRWRFAGAVAAIIAFMDLAESLNSMPAAIRGYTTTMSFKGYMLDVYLSAAWSAVGQFLQAFVLAGAAEGLYRIFYPGKTALERLFSTGGLKSRQVISGLAAGHLLFGMHLGWVVLYYLFGRRLGIWSPLEVRNIEGLSNTLPFFSAMNVGASASFFEELTYRVLGMIIMQKLVRNFWLANLLQAAAWAFMHSNYPQEPPWARGVELTAVGLLYGVVLRSFGLIACLCSHYVFDAFLGVQPLFVASQPALQASACLAVAPFLVALVLSLVLRSRGPSPDEESLTNAQIRAVRKHSEFEEIFPATPYQYKPLSGGLRKALIVMTVAACLLEFGYFFPVVAQRATLTVSRDDALAIARRYLLERKISPYGRFEAAELNQGLDSLALQYIFEKEKFARAAELAVKASYPLMWQVRFFRPLDPEEYTVWLTSRGEPISLTVSLAEDAPGAKLTRDQALSKADAFLAAEHREMLPLKFEDASSTIRKNRTDWVFTYGSRQYTVAEADFKVEVTVIGDMVGGYRCYWQLPDHWIWEKSRRTTKDQFCGYLVSLIQIAAFAAFIWWCVGVARSGAIRWRPVAMLALAVSLLAVPQALNDLPRFFVLYRTDTPLLSYFVGQAVRQILTPVSTIAIVAGLGAFGLGSFRLMFPRNSPAAILKTAISGDSAAERAARLEFWLDATLAGYAFGIGYTALTVISAAIHSWWSPVVALAPLSKFCNLANVFNPSLDVFTDALSRAVSFILLCGVLVGLYAKYFRSARGYLLLALLVSLSYPSTDKYWQDYIVDAAAFFVYALGVWVLIARVARQNLLAYFLAALAAVFSGSIRVLMMHAPVFFARDIAILLLILASPAIYVAVLEYKSRAEGSSAAD